LSIALFNVFGGYTLTGQTRREVVSLSTWPNENQLSLDHCKLVESPLGGAGRPMVGRHERHGGQPLIGTRHTFIKSEAAAGRSLIEISVGNPPVFEGFYAIEKNILT